MMCLIAVPTSTSRALCLSVMAVLDVMEVELVPLEVLRPHEQIIQKKLIN